jgi:large subunit ribosomal protein L24
MKLRLKDKVMMTVGRDKGKTGEVVKVLPKENQVVVEGINIVKRATKPSNKHPRGGILEITKPVNVSKVMAIDPTSGKPARIAYAVGKDGTKERIFKVSANHTKKPAAKPAKEAESK